MRCTRPTRFGSLKQHFAGGHVAPLGHINLIPSQPVFAGLTPKSCVLSRKAANTDLRVFRSTQLGLTLM